MTISELKNELDKIGVSQDLYSIMVGGLPNERLCIVKKEMWKIYYSERGRRGGKNLLKQKRKPVNISLES